MIFVDKRPIIHLNDRLALIVDCESAFSKKKMGILKFCVDSSNSGWHFAECPRSPGEQN